MIGHPNKQTNKDYYFIFIDTFNWEPIHLDLVKFCADSDLISYYYGNYCMYWILPLKEKDESESFLTELMLKQLEEVEDAELLVSRVLFSPRTRPPWQDRRLEDTRLEDTSLDETRLEDIRLEDRRLEDTRLEDTKDTR